MKTDEQILRENGYIPSLIRGHCCNPKCRGYIRRGEGWQYGNVKGSARWHFACLPETATMTYNEILHYEVMDGIDDY